MIKYVLNHIWVFILIIALVLIPQSLNIQSELNMRIIVTGFAIDKKDNQFELTAQVVLPTPQSESSGSASLQFISAEGKSIAEAIEKISFQLGKTSGLSQATFIIMGQDFIKDGNLQPNLDYFLRNTRIPSTASILIAKDKASDEIKKTGSLELSSGIGIQKIFLYKENAMNGISLSVQDFSNNYFNPSSTSVVGGIEIEKGEKEQTSEENRNQNASETGQNSNQEVGGQTVDFENNLEQQANIKTGEDISTNQSSDSSSDNALSGNNAQNQNSGQSSTNNQNSNQGGSGGEATSLSGSSNDSSSSGTSKNSGSSSESSDNSSGNSQSSSGESSGQSSQSSEGSDTKNTRIRYKSPIYCFKNGKYVCKIEDEKSMQGVYLANPHAKEGSLTLQHVYDQKLTDATITVYLRDKKVKLKTKFVDGVPHCTMYISTNRNEIIEIENKISDLNIYEADDTYFTQTTIRRIEEEIKSCVLKAYEEAKICGADIYKIADRFYKKNTKEWGDFINNLENKDLYLNSINFDVEVDFKEML